MQHATEKNVYCLIDLCLIIFFTFIFTLQGAFTQINCSSPLYVGGVPEYDKTKKTAGVIKPFTGIVQKVLQSQHAETSHLYLNINRQSLLIC